jgi:RNA recognition motif-containing protein
MNTKIRLDNLAAATTENDVMDLVSSYGNVVAVSVPVDPASGRPHGFGFVTMATPEGARSAIEGLNGKVIGTLTLTVSEREEHGRPGARGSPRRGSSRLF